MRVRHALSYDDALGIAQAGLAFAGAQRWPICIAVVDDAGHPIVVLRMDEASPAAVDGAIGKARTSTLTGIDSAVIEQMAQARPTVLSIPRIAVEGGVALVWQGQRVGGVGASGQPPARDAQVAAAALAAFGASDA